VPLCGSSFCGCALTSIPANFAEINGASPTIDVAGNGTSLSPWNLTLNDEWAGEVADAVNNRSRWQPIGAGDESSLTITVPSGVSRIRCAWRGNNSVDGYLGVRINNDSTANLYARSHQQINAAGGFSDTADGVLSTAWRAGPFLGVLESWGEFEIDIDDLRCPMWGLAYRQGVPSGSARWVSWGLLDSDRTTTSVVLFPTSGSLSSFVWRADGYFA
jgi:hypothetical protein